MLITDISEFCKRSLLSAKLKYADKNICGGHRATCGGLRSTGSNKA